LSFYLLHGSAYPEFLAVLLFLLHSMLMQNIFSLVSQILVNSGDLFVSLVGAKMAESEWKDIVACPMYPDKFTLDSVIAPLILIVTLPELSK